MTGNRAYTLLEVVLSLVLTSLVLLCVAMAVDFQLRIADAGRTHVEEAQLARVLLHRIADDLRNTVVADPLDFEKLTASASTTYGSTSESGTEDEDSSAALADELDDDTSTDQITAEEVTDPSQAMLAHTVVGLYGGPDWIQVDTDRPANPAHGAAPSADDLSSAGPTGDLKTVIYYVVTPDDSAVPTGPEPRAGLIRRELDRAVSQSAEQESSTGQLLLGEKPLAPEVAELAFRYSDGTTWYDSWDTAQSGNVPLAVEITLTLRPRTEGGDWTAALADSDDTASTSDQENTVYRLIVDIPMAKAAPATTTEESGSTDSQSSTESSGTESGGSSSSSSESP